MKGKKNRLSRILSPETGRGLIVAIDHGMALGPMTGIENPGKVFETLEPWTDAWLMTKGIFTHVYEPKGNKGIILRASGGATIAGPDITREGVTASVEELLMLSADAVAFSVYIGSPNEHETLRSLSMLADSCRRWEIPLVGVTAVGKDKEKAQDPKFIALCARVAAEHGADIVKTYYTAEDFEKVTAGCPVPIAIAGGPKCDTDEETLAMIRGSLDRGAAGIVMGRNIWQSPRAVALIQAVHAMIHDDTSLKEAVDLLNHSA
jgi:DhnA family fructose-bisphosphate aldolase class Ia